MFRQRQGIAHYLWGISIFLKEVPHRKNLIILHEFVCEWESIILDPEDTHGITIAVFVLILNELMKECGV
jgi:hypothetical protein